MNISYKMISKLVDYMEKEIEDIALDYRDLSWKYNETCKYENDMKNGKRSFYTNYGIDKKTYDDMVRHLRIRQYELYLELQQLINDCKDQNDGKPYLSYSIHLKRRLICINPSYDNVVEELNRLRETGENENV